MEVDKQPNLDSWDDFAGEWIKADYISEFPAKLVCIGVEGASENGKPKLIANVEYKQRKWKFDLNKTNQNFIRASGITKPKLLIGKVLVVDKTKVRNPSLNQMVDSLVIIDISK
jgi:hypothetical protein